MKFSPGRTGAAHRITVLLLEPVIGFDAAIAPQLFIEAFEDADRPPYELTMASLTGAPVWATPGYSILPTGDARALATADTVIIPGTQLPGPRTDGTLPSAVRDALALIKPGARLVSICTGAFVLAAAGLLDGRPATTHWATAESFRSLYPDVLLDENLLYIDDGDLLSSAGLAAGIDLCLHMIRSDLGVEVANAVAKHCVVASWRHGGQAQFIEHAVELRDGQSTSAARAWALDNLADSLDVAQLAAQAGMSVRTFNRRLREEVGLAPGAWLIEQRIQQARRLLESTDLTIDDIARRCGLGTGASLRQHLRASVGISPSAYRQTFRG